MSSALLTNTRFRREHDGSIYTPGIDFGGKITVIHANGSRELWQRASGSVWNGRGCPRAYLPAELWVVEINYTQGRFTALESVEVVRPLTLKGVAADLMTRFFTQCTAREIPAIGVASCSHAEGEFDKSKEMTNVEPLTEEEIAAVDRFLDSIGCEKIDPEVK